MTVRQRLNRTKNMMEARKRIRRPDRNVFVKPGAGIHSRTPMRFITVSRNKIRNPNKKTPFAGETSRAVRNIRNVLRARRQRGRFTPGMREVLSRNLAILRKSRRDMVRISRRRRRY